MLKGNAIVMGKKGVFGKKFGHLNERGKFFEKA